MTADNRYRYNAKEEQAFLDLPYTDYGARMRDPKYGIGWNRLDDLSEVTPGISPFAFCLNNPINAIDRNGNIVIFINGFSLFQGSTNYPRPGNTFTGNSWTGTRNYWQSSGDFDYKVMRQLNDYNVIYRDGQTGGPNDFGHSSLNAGDRYGAGYGQGALDAPQIISRLARNKEGAIVETIKMITHSMGAAYGKGYMTALVQYLEESGLSKDVVEFEADFAPYQSTEQRAVDGIPTYQFSHADDTWAKNKKMQGAIKMDTSSDPYQGHRLGYFIPQINNLPEGTYTFEDGKIKHIK